MIHAEFVGGPKDGERMVFVDQRESVVFSRWLTGGQRTDHTYQQRRVNGIRVKLASGFYEFVYTGRPSRPRGD